MHNAVRTALGYGIRWTLRRRIRQTLLQAAHCRQTQWETLQRLLRLNGDSEFSVEFKLGDIRSVADFRKALPVAGYERCAPYVERMKQGHPEALLGPRNRLLMFALTSGTTEAAKFIPITSRFLSDYRRGWQDWGILAFDAHPRLHGRPLLQLCSDFDRFRTRSGIACGNISGLVPQMQSRVVQALYSVPASALKIRDPLARYYFSLKHSLRCRDLGLITTANPSTLLKLFQMLSEYAELLIRDLYDGTISIPTDCSLPPESMGDERNRARELDRLLQSTGRLSPRDVWPELQLMAVWTGGSAAAYLPALREWLGDLPIRDHGLHASEGRMTIPLADETSSGLLDIGAHFFEFIPEEEIDSLRPVVLEAHELEEGRTYYILLTTSSGLYRYNIHDVVECTGFYRGTPLLRFLHKGSHVSSVTGEKLTESNVVRAVTRVIQRTGRPLGDFAMAPQWGDPPCYVLLVEADQFPEISQALQFAQQVEEEIMALNTEYAEKRQSARLGGVSARLLPPGTWQRFSESRRRAAGGAAEQYKHPFLFTELNFHPSVSGPPASVALR